MQVDQAHLPLPSAPSQPPQEKRREKRFLAIKTINKKSIVNTDEEEQNNKVQALLNERQILQHCEHPFIVTLHYFFQDATRLYFGMSMAGSGDFYAIMEDFKGEGLPMYACRFYAAGEMGVGDRECIKRDSEEYIK